MSIMPIISDYNWTRDMSYYRQRKAADSLILCFFHSKISSTGAFKAKYECIRNCYVDSSVYKFLLWYIMKWELGFNFWIRSLWNLRI